MKVNYLELMSDQMPAYVVADWIADLEAQAEHQGGDTTKPTQDLLAAEMRGNDVAG